MSSFAWADDLPEGVKDEATGFVLECGVAHGEKCPRCWKYVEHPNEHGLCERCAHVMHED